MIQSYVTEINISDFGENLKKREREGGVMAYPVFSTNDKILAINGPDGVGKSSICQALVKTLNGLSVPTVLVKPTTFEESVRSKKIGQELENSGFDRKSKQHNRFYLRALAYNYRDRVLPLTTLGYMVVLDSSEVRALAFMRDLGSHEAYQDTIEWLRCGALTYKTIATHQIFLYAQPNELYHNLMERDKKDTGDPGSISAVENRLSAYREAVSLVRSLPTDNKINWIEIHNPPSEKPEQSIRGIVDQIMEGVFL